MNTLAKISPNQLEKATEALKKFKDYVVPNEIREDEAHLNHIIIAQATPNKNTFEFETKAQVVMLNDESLIAVKPQLPKYGAVVFLHDAKQYKADKAKEEKEAKEKAEADAQAKKEADEKAKADAETESQKQIKAKDDEIAELRKKLEGKQPKVEVKADAKADAEKTGEATEDATKKANGKG